MHVSSFSFLSIFFNPKIFMLKIKSVEINLKLISWLYGSISIPLSARDNVITGSCKICFVWNIIRQIIVFSTVGGVKLQYWVKYFVYTLPNKTKTTQLNEECDVSKRRFSVSTKIPCKERPFGLAREVERSFLFSTYLGRSRTSVRKVTWKVSLCAFLRTKDCKEKPVRWYLYGVLVWADLGILWSRDIYFLCILVMSKRL